MQKTIKREIVSKKSLKQVIAFNEKVTKFYTNNGQQQKNIDKKISELKSNIEALEVKKYKLNEQSLNHTEYQIPIEAKGHDFKPVEGEAEFYQSVIAHATVVDHDEVKSFEVYQLEDGKWYEAGVRIPATFDENGKCNGMDESKVYFKKIEVVI